VLLLVQLDHTDRYQMHSLHQKVFCAVQQLQLQGVQCGGCLPHLDLHIQQTPSTDCGKAEQQSKRYNPCFSDHIALELSAKRPLWEVLCGLSRYSARDLYSRLRA
jgi:hypothetical protein